MAMGALSGCTTPAPMHSEAQLDPVAVSCGVAPGELVQDQDPDGKGLLVLVRRNPSDQQRSCVRQWARHNNLRPVYLAIERSQVDLNEGCAMIALLAAGLSFHLVKVDPTYLPAINMSGKVQRVVGMTIKGAPQLIPTLKQRVEAEGWKARLADERCVEVNPAGHSLDEVTALSFRVNNGEFGDLKLNFILRPDGKTKG